MLLLCWNVAGLGTTVNRIHEFFAAHLSAKDTLTSNDTSISSSQGSNPHSNTSNKQRKKPLHPAAALTDFFTRHQADIVCLQEHKIPINQLRSRSEPHQCASLPGYESFWSCSTDVNSKGRNGVVTYARVGTVHGGNSRILEPDSLNDQGRCIVTYHAQFTLFNVYVPASGGTTLSDKMLFLRALRCAMQRERERRGLPVILVGDYNISPTKDDLVWTRRLIDVTKDMELALPPSGANNCANQHKMDVNSQRFTYDCWPILKKALETRQVMPVQTCNPQTGEKFEKYRVMMMHDERKIQFGKYETCPEYAMRIWEMDEQTWYDGDAECEKPLCPANLLSMDCWIELMQKIMGVEWDVDIQRHWSDTHADVNKLAPPRAWFRSLVEEDGMVDCFRHYYPTAQDRFTCWDQSTNRRYYNQGSRIDMTLVDSCLLSKVGKGEVDRLRCCHDYVPLNRTSAVHSATAKLDPLGHMAAAQAATAGGLFQPVSFNGGGIADADYTAIMTQFGPPHTGMVYTPPSYSDHIAISLYMDDSVMSYPNHEVKALDRDSATQRAQPHKAQRTIHSFVVKREDIVASNGSKHTDQSLDGNKRPSEESSQTSSESHLVDSANNKVKAGIGDSTSNSVKRYKRTLSPSTRQSSKNTLLHHFVKKKINDNNGNAGIQDGK
jgi:exonuclease III